MRQEDVDDFRAFNINPDHILECLGELHGGLEEYFEPFLKMNQDLVALSDDNRTSLVGSASFRDAMLRSLTAALEATDRSKTPWCLEPTVLQHPGV